MPVLLFGLLFPGWTPDNDIDTIVLDRVCYHSLQRSFAMGPFSITEVIVVLAVIILLFGSKRIPELAKGLGGGIRGFKDALHGKDEAKEIQK